MSWKLEVRLVATDGGLDSAVPVARTTDPVAVRTVGALVVAEARREATALARQDRVLGLIARGEARKLAAVLRAVGSDDLGPVLGFVEGRR